VIWWSLSGFAAVLAWCAAGRRLSLLVDRLVRLPFHSPVELPAVRDVLAQRGPHDEVTYTAERSLLSWPTPLAMNFMTGWSSSWRRHIYYRLVWKQHSGATLEMVWRYEQWYYRRQGWSSGTMTNGASTGLIRETTTAPPNPRAQ
jgi:hypothetical protein